MNTLTKLLMPFVLLLLPVSLISTVVDTFNQKEKWKILTPNVPSHISRIYDKNKEVYVTLLKGKGTKSTYLLALNERLQKNEKNILSWEMKYSEDFSIIVTLQTKKGKRYLIYTPGEESSFMQYGLGSESQSGKWKYFQRNVDQDLAFYDENNSIEKVENFVIRGSGYLDNIQVLIMKLEAKVEKKLNSEIPHQPIVKRILKNRRVKSVNSTPKIKMEGEATIYLDVGEMYIEPGVSAINRDAEPMILVSSDDIDSSKEGKYSIMYIATDKYGNSAIKTRYVIVGTPKEETYVLEKEKIIHDEKIELLGYDENLENEKRDLIEWEKELALREKRILEKEQLLNASEKKYKEQ